MVSYSRRFLEESIEILRSIPDADVERVAEVIVRTREAGGRLFFCGSGGGAGHASHATCDFRKMGGFEAYCVTDNVSELTARVNDDGWDGAYAEWLRGSRLASGDCVFVFSVGGGDEERGISTNLVNAVRLAREVGAAVVGIVGRDGGLVKKVADACIVIPTVNPDHVTAQTEGLQALFWHLLVMHPSIVTRPPKWESATA